MENKNNNIPWIPIIELAVLAFTTLGTTISLHMHSDSKMESQRKEYLTLARESNEKMDQFRKEWLQETKDFHGRLISLEERSKGLKPLSDKDTHLP